VIGLAIVAFAAVAVIVVVAIQARRSTAAGVQLFRSPTAVVDVARDEHEAARLCKQALREVAGTMTSYAFENGKLNVRSHLEGEPASAQSLEFRVEPLDATHTRIRVSADAYPYNARYARKRVALIHQFAAWLAAHGDGRA
jgi:hypothetical protein